MRPGSEAPRAARHPLARTARLAGWGLLLAALAGSAVAATARSTFWGEIVVNLRAYVGLTALAGGLLLVAARHLGPALAAVALTAYHAAPLAALHVADAPPLPESGPVLRVASVNLNYGNDDAEAFLAWVEGERPDVLAVMEVTPFWRGVLEGLGELYPHQVFEPVPAEKFAVALLSRAPLLSAEVHATPHAWRSYIEARVAMGGEGPGPGATALEDALHVIALHPARPGRGWGKHERDALLAEVAAETDWGPHSVVLADLNATVYSPAYDDFLHSSGLRDSRRGFGWLPSWRSVKYLPGVWLDLDQIFVGEGVGVLEREVGPNVGSDHRPVSAVLRLGP